LTVFNLQLIMIRLAGAGHIVLPRAQLVKCVLFINVHVFTHYASDP